MLLLLINPSSNPMLRFTASAIIVKQDNQVKRMDAGKEDEKKIHKKEEDKELHRMAGN